MLETVALWATVVGVVLALLAIAWSAVNYILIRRRELAYQEYKTFFEVMENLGAPGGSVASKMGAAYELRKYPQYRDVIVRLAEKVLVDGPGGQMLREELNLTKRFLQGEKT